MKIDLDFVTIIVLIICVAITILIPAVQLMAYIKAKKATKETETSSSEDSGEYGGPIVGG